MLLSRRGDWAFLSPFCLLFSLFDFFGWPSHDMPFRYFVVTERVSDEFLHPLKFKSSVISFSDSIDNHVPTKDGKRTKKNPREMTKL